MLIHIHVLEYASRWEFLIPDCWPCIVSMTWCIWLLLNIVFRNHCFFWSIEAYSRCLRVWYHSSWWSSMKDQPSALWLFYTEVQQTTHITTCAPFFTSQSPGFSPNPRSPARPGFPLRNVGRQKHCPSQRTLGAGTGHPYWALQTLSAHIGENSS